MRRLFEERTWKRGEPFSEYANEKIILANRVPIAEDKTVDYLIDGIPDGALRDQARLHQFANVERLIDAFEKITLYAREHAKPAMRSVDTGGKDSKCNSNIRVLK